jgi:hypothetical protein
MRNQLYRPIVVALLGIHLWLEISALAAPLGTAFTYQGRLNSAGSPATGVYDLRFALYDSLTNGGVVAGPLTNTATGVTNGLFTVTLDFGAVFGGSAQWLELAVRTNGADAFTPLSPRQALTPAPYALFASNATTAATAAVAASAKAVAATNVSGTLQLAQLPAGIVTNGATGLTLSGAFAGDGNGLTKLDSSSLTGMLAASSALGMLAHIDNGGTAKALTVSGNYCYLANDSDGLRIYDISSASAPKSIGNTNAGGLPCDLALSGNYCCVATYTDGLRIYDVSNPAHPTPAGWTNDGNYVFGVAVSGNYCYVANYSAGLRVYDISNPAHPTCVAHTNDGGYAYSVAVSGRYCYLGNDSDGLRIYDISTPTNPISLGHTNNGGKARGLVVSGNYCYLANFDDGLRIYDISDPTLPRNVGHIDDGGNARSLTVSGNRCYVANDSDGLRIYDISNPAAPTNVAHAYVAGAAWGVAVSGNYCYLANSTDGLRIFGLTSFKIDGQINLTGTVGLGTATPQKTLDIEAKATADGLRVNGSDGVAPSIQLSTNGTSCGELGAAVSPGNYSVDATPGDFVIRSAAAAKLLLQNGTGSAAISISNNLVGIGKPAARSALDVNGTVTASNFIGNGSGLTSLNAASLVGTVDMQNVDFDGGITFTNYSFHLAASPAVGAGPFSVVAADVNGDGAADLICADRQAAKLSVLTNNGAGAFVLASSPAVGTTPFSVLAADVNGDGAVDLICANFDANTLSVLTNNGRGGFLLASSPVTGVNPSSVAAADVNGDGAIDLICANSGANTLSVLTNNGAGAFVLASSPAVGSGPHSVVAADVNGDAAIDLVCANSGANTLSVLTNNGAGAFVPASSPAVGSSPISVVAADVNGDAAMDLICANSGANTLSVLTNNGAGAFVLASSPAVGSGPHSVVAADVNGDSVVDLICANYGSSTLSVLTGVGRGNFVLIASPAAGSGSIAVAAADVNRDGRNDLISANYGANTLSVLTNALPFWTFEGCFAGNGTALTNLSAASLTGTMSDTLLSTNVALLNASQTFRGTNVFSGYLGVGAADIGAPLTISSESSYSGNLLKLQARAEPGAYYLLGRAATSTRNVSWNFDQINYHSTYSNALVIQNGNLGLGTDSPQKRLHVTALGTADGVRVEGNGFAPALQLSTNGTACGELGVPMAAGQFSTEAAAGDFVIRSATGKVLLQNGAGSSAITISNNLVGIGNVSPTNRLMVVNARCDGSSWINASDRNLKQEFAPVDARAVLDKVAALPVQTWSYKAQPGQKHLGPVAQDFFKAFNLGADDVSIATVDESGVALAAIQGLNQKNLALEKEVSELRALVKALAAKIEAGQPADPQRPAASSSRLPPVPGAQPLCPVPAPGSPGSDAP